MCILFFIVNGNPSPGGYKLILASNRDEFFNRPTLQAAHWKENESIVGGRDNEPGKEGGTWLGIAEGQDQFRIGALLNIVDLSRNKSLAPLIVGRGFLVSNYLKDNRRCEEYITDLIKNKQMYQGFNLVTIEINKSAEKPVSIKHCSNCDLKRSFGSWEQETAIGVGNSPPNTPLRKVAYGQEQFNDIVKTYGQRSDQKEDLVEHLLNLLQDKEKQWPDDELKKRHLSGNPELLSSINVRIMGHGYGTRTHTIILIDERNQMDYIEHTMDGVDPDVEWKVTRITNYT